MNYGKRLQYAREFRGFSQRALAAESGVTQSTISRIERGDQDSSLHDIQLSKALRISPFWLSAGEGPMELPEGFFEQQPETKVRTEAPSIDKLMRRSEALSATEMKTMQAVHERLDRLEKAAAEDRKAAESRHAELKQLVSQLSNKSPAHPSKSKH